MSNLFTPVITTKYQLDNQGVPVVAGQIIATTDTHEFYVDLDSIVFLRLKSVLY